MIMFQKKIILYNIRKIIVIKIKFKIINVIFIKIVHAVESSFILLNI